MKENHKICIQTIKFHLKTKLQRINKSHKFVIDFVYPLTTSGTFLINV